MAGPRREMRAVPCATRSVRVLTIRPLSPTSGPHVLLHPAARRPNVDCIAPGYDQRRQQRDVTGPLLPAHPVARANGDRVVARVVCGRAALPQENHLAQPRRLEHAPLLVPRTEFGIALGLARNPKWNSSVA